MDDLQSMIQSLTILLIVFTINSSIYLAGKVLDYMKYRKIKNIVKLVLSDEYVREHLIHEILAEVKKRMEPRREPLIKRLVAKFRRNNGRKYVPIHPSAFSAIDRKYKPRGR